MKKALKVILTLLCLMFAYAPDPNKNKSAVIPVDWWGEPAHAVGTLKTDPPQSAYLKTDDGYYLKMD